MSAASSVDQKISEADEILARLSGNMSEARLRLLKHAMDQANDVDFDDGVEKAAANFDDDSTDDDESGNGPAVLTKLVAGRRRLEKPITDDTDSDTEEDEMTTSYLLNRLDAMVATHARRCRYELTPKEAKAIHQKVAEACKDPKDRELFAAVHDFYNHATRDCWNSFMDNLGGEVEVSDDEEDGNDEEDEKSFYDNQVLDERKTFVLGAKHAMDILAPFSADYRPGVNRHCIPHEGKTVREETQSIYEGFINTIIRREKIAKEAAENGELDVVIPVSDSADVPEKEPVTYYHIPDSKLDDFWGPDVVAPAAVAVEATVASAPVAVASIKISSVAVVANPVRRVIPTAVVSAEPVAVVVDAKSDAVQSSKKRKAEGSMQSQIDARVKAAHLAGVKPQPMTLEEARQIRAEKAELLSTEKKVKTIDSRKAKKAEAKEIAKPKVAKVITPEMQSSIDAIVASVKARAALSSASSSKSAFEVAIVDSLSSAASADEYFDIATDIIASSALDDVADADADDDL